MTQEYWTAQKKETAAVDGPVYSVDENPSFVVKWASGEPNEDLECVGLTKDGFKDESCSKSLLYVCKMSQSTYAQKCRTA